MAPNDSHVPFGMPRPSTVVRTPTEPAGSLRNGDAPVDAVESPSILPDGTRIDVEADARDSGVFDVLADLDRELVGLEPVKTRIREIAALLIIDTARRRFGLETDGRDLHMCVTGNTGAGKRPRAS